jgi:hypothetical protein
MIDPGGIVSPEDKKSGTDGANGSGRGGCSYFINSTDKRIDEVFFFEQRKYLPAERPRLPGSLRRLVWILKALHVKNRWRVWGINPS